MMVSDKQVHQVARLFAAQMHNRAAGTPSPSGPGMRPDRVELSQESREVQAARQAIARTPDVREETVARIKAALETGTYRVSGLQVAQKMLGRTLVDRLR
ncbi:MAG: flagellar biosynthesis anti-sigma factor FlgM [Firmicutes bacterium]|nr:flagellar biosynthesis anti-sigma factor FlgM [Bacillota bacterium]